MRRSFDHKVVRATQRNAHEQRERGKRREEKSGHLFKKKHRYSRPASVCGESGSRAAVVGEGKQREEEDEGEWIGKESVHPD